MRKTLRVVVITYIAYLVITLLVITPLLNFLPKRFVEKTYNRELQTEWVILNPFKLSLDISRAQLNEPDGERFVSLEDATVNLSLASIWAPGWVLDAIGFKELYVNVVQQAEGEFNFSDLIASKESPEEEEETETGAVPGVTIRDFSIHSEAILYTDNTREKPYTSQWNGLNITVLDLSTVLEDGKPYKLSVNGEAGGQLNWEGTVSIPNARSEGSLSLDNLSMPALWGLAEPWLEFEITDGRFGLTGQYEVSWKDEPDYRITDGRMQLTTVDIAPKSPEDIPDTGVQLQSLTVDTIVVDGGSEEITIEGVLVDGLGIAGWMEGEQISLADLFLGLQSQQEIASTSPQPTPADETQTQATEEAPPATDDNAAEASNETPPVSEEASANEEAVAVEEQATPTPENVPASEAEAVAAGEDRQAADNSAQLAGEETQATSEPPAGRADEETAPGWRVQLGGAKVVNSHVSWRSPFTDPPQLEIQPIEASIEQVSWPLSGESPLSLSLAINEQVKVNVDGALALGEGLGTVNYKLEGLPLTWANPNLPEALKAQFTSGAIQIDGDISLAQFAPTLINLAGAISDFSAHAEGVEESLTEWNTVRVEGLSVDMEQNHLTLGKLAIDDYKGRLHIAKDGSVNASNVWQQETGEQVEEIKDQLQDDKPWTFDISEVLITDSEIDFMDQSLPILFRAVVGDLNGQIKGMSTGPEADASIELNGSVEGYAPVVIAGDFNPFDLTADQDLDMTFTGMDMSLLSPYSGNYAGYAIEQGVLNLHLHYTLEGGNLTGKNDLILDQLKLGEQIESDQAIDAPLGLALSILTDSNGIIDMKVPVSGNIDDPAFSIGGIIFKAFLNIITKAVTAPFTLLAGLVGSEDDLQRLTFASGSVELDQAGKVKLDTLNAALEQRPGLSLVMTGTLNLAADRERMQKDTVKAELVEKGLSQEELDSKGPEWDKAIAKRYKSAGFTPTEAEEPTTREKYLQIASSIQISDKQMLELAEQRAIAVKTYLVNEVGMAADRAAIGKSNLDEKENLFSGVSLGVD